jgi:hypothetical protein
MRAVRPRLERVFLPRRAAASCKFTPGNGCNSESLYKLGRWGEERMIGALITAIE